LIARKALTSRSAHKQWRKGAVMSRLDVLIPALNLEADQAALRLGAALAERHGGAATALFVGVSLGSDYCDAESPLSEVLADMAAGGRSVSATEHDRLGAWLGEHLPEVVLRETTVENAATRDEIAAYSRMADLVVLARANAHARARNELAEDILFKSGRSLLLAPPHFHARRAPERILVAWNASASATRAVANALPLLQAASAVRIVTIDAVPSVSGHGEAPGRELAAYLAARDVPAEVSNLDGLGRDHALRLEVAALDFDANLIVMGGYGHSRAREFVLGGVTRSLLRASRFPLFLAH
jgi:nucleotide-binding universal stress UspA family protein